MIKIMHSDKAINAIDAANIGMVYGNRVVLKNIDLIVPSGQGLCLCGTNGVGKSTLLRIIAGLLSSTHGTVTICGVDMQKAPLDARRQLGLISHQSMLYMDLTVMENLRFTAQLYGIKKPGPRIQELLEATRLTGYIYDRVKILSRGMLQRLAICRALIHRPRILLADEPFTGLDIKSTEYFLNTIELFKSDGGSVVLTTHETHLGLCCCDRVVVMDGSKIVFDAQVADIEQNSFARDYLAYSRRKA